MLQYKIPQNVGIEDKIVGPFSLRQLIMLAVGGGISYVLFAISSKLYELNVLEYILIALPALFALAAAMLKIHNVSFIKYLMLLLEFAIKPKKRMWDHRGISALVAPDLTDSAAAKKPESKDAQVLRDRKNVNLRDLSATLDSGGFEHVQQVNHEDIDEVQDDDLITEAYFGHKQAQSDTQNMYWRTRDMQKKKLNLLAKMEKAQKSAKTGPTPAAADAPKAQPSAQTATAPPPPTQPATEPKVTPATPAPTQTQGKESVTEHLASVIKEARQSNRTRNEMERKAETASATVTKQATEVPKQGSEPSKTSAGNIPASPSKPGPQSAVQSENQAEPSAAPKKRKRKRRKKAGPGPVREGTQVDTTDRQKPVKLLDQADKKQGETSFNDLSGGDEIEFNLD